MIILRTLNVDMTAFVKGVFSNFAIITADFKIIVVILIFLIKNTPIKN